MPRKNRNKAIERLVSELSNGFEYNWTKMWSQRDAADHFLTLLAEVKLIDHCYHPMGGSVWKINNKLFGRTDSMTIRKFNKILRDKKREVFIEKL